MREAIAGTIVLLMAASLALAGEAGAGQGSGTRFDGMKIRAERPRIWLDAEKIAWLKEKTAGKTVPEVRQLAGSTAEGLALAYVISGDEATGREAIKSVEAMRGRQTSSMAVVYDWCYPLLSGDEKESWCKLMVEATQKAIATGRSWRSFHNSLYSTGVPVSLAMIALAGDDPYTEEAFAFLNGQWEDVLRTFDNVFPDGAWGEGFDYNRHVTLEALRYFTALEAATGNDYIADSQHMKNTGYYIMYGTKPDTLAVPRKDNDFPFVGQWERETLMMLASEYRNGYFQYFIDHCPAEEFALAGRNRWRELIWRDDSIKAQDPSGLPASRIFRDDGLVIARSGWGWDGVDGRARDTWVSFRCGDYFGDHAHYDNNSFEIYYKGELAIDSGRYDDDWGMEEEPGEIAKSEFFNYYQRTIAHNTVLVYDPDEKFELGVLNDGGQLELLRVSGVRNVPEDYDQGTFPSEGGVGTCDWATNPGRWETGDILGYAGTKDFTYVCGDATKSYSAAKMKSFVRQFVFVQPNIIAVFDKVEATKPELKKTWLLHTIEEPQISGRGREITASYGEGRLVCVPVLPEKRTLVKVGGPDDECMVAGVQFHYGPKASSGRDAEIHFGELPGAWRIEESPAEASATDFFLNVMRVDDKSSSDTIDVAISKQDDNSITIWVVPGDGSSVWLTFNKSGAAGGSIRIEKNSKVVYEGAFPQGVIVEEGRPR